MSYQPLRITFQIAGGWVPPRYPLHLDALLAYCVTERELADLEQAPEGASEIIAIAEDPKIMPLSRFEKDGQWVWMASAITPVRAVLNDSRFLTRRTYDDDFPAAVGIGAVKKGNFRPDKPAPNSGHIDATRGTFRNRLEYFPVQHDATGEGFLLQAWCLGDLDRIDELLTDDFAPSHIGANRRMGLGRIVGVTIEHDPQAHEKWKNRVKPWPLLDDECQVIASCKAPYWLSTNRQQAWMPVLL